MNSKTAESTPQASPNKIMIVNAAESDITRVVIAKKAARKNEMIHFDIDSKLKQNKQTMSNIYKAVVTSIEVSLAAVFVNFGNDRHGFLPLSNISSEYFNESYNGTPRSEDLPRLIKIGQELVVQVEKEERGNKGAAMTTFISLAGSYVVLMPNNDRGGGVSRQIEGPERDALKNNLDQLEVPEGMSLIARTAAVGRSAEDLKWDLSILQNYWDAIKKAAIAKPGPYLIAEESNVVLRSVRDHFRHDIAEVVIDDEAAYEQVKGYINLVRPDFIDRIKHYQEHTPIFSYYQVETQVETAYQREIRLPSGGSIVIDSTEALIAIDVNSSRATKGNSIEETAYQTNLEATDEIAKQIRFRDLSGLIMIDYIDMLQAGHRRTVEERLANAMSIDRARIQMLPISRLGVLELSRQRLRRTLTRLTKITCPRCNGQGLIRTIESIASSIIHTMQDNQARSSKPLHFTLQCPLDLTTFLMNERRADIQRLTDHNQTKVTIIPNQHLITPAYQLKQTELVVSGDGNSESPSKNPSYQQMKQGSNIDNSLITKRSSQAMFNEPVINQYLTMPEERESQSQGLLGRLTKRWFGASQTEPTPPPKEEEEKPSARRNNRRGNSRGKQQESRDEQRPKRQQRRRSDAPANGRRRSNSNETSEKPKTTDNRTASNQGNTLRSTPKTSDSSNKRSTSRRGTRGGSRQQKPADENLNKQTAPKVTPEKEPQTEKKAPEKTAKPSKPAAKPVEANKPVTPAPVEKLAPTVTAESKTPKKKSLSSARSKTGHRHSRPMPTASSVEKNKAEKAAKAADLKKTGEKPAAPRPRYKKTPSSARQTPARKRSVTAEKKAEDAVKTEGGEKDV